MLEPQNDRGWCQWGPFFINGVHNWVCRMMAERFLSLFPGKIHWGGAFRLPMFCLVCFAVLVLLGGIGCSVRMPTRDARLASACNLTEPHMGLRRNTFDTRTFSLASWHTDLEAAEGKYLSVYIEGDGLAWISFSKASSDPTPLNPMGLKLFLQDPSPDKIYLARPCQFVPGPDCRREYWTGSRFAPEVIYAFDQVLDKIKERYHPSGFFVYGYSGGGAVAALLAARRNDVRGLVTIAGNLDTDHWTNLHRLTPLKRSLNPADAAADLADLPQIHLIGGKDWNVDVSVFRSFAARFPHKRQLQYKVFPEFDHSNGWDLHWSAIVADLDVQGLVEN